MVYDIKRSGERVRQLRIQHGYTQDELAAAMNINRSFLSRIESGKKGCSVDLFVQFSEFFQISLDFLILGKETDAAQETECKEQLKAEITSLIDRLTMFQKELWPECV